MTESTELPDVKKAAQKVAYKIGGRPDNVLIEKAELLSMAGVPSDISAIDPDFWKWDTDFMTRLRDCLLSTKARWLGSMGSGVYRLYSPAESARVMINTSTKKVTREVLRCRRRLKRMNVERLTADQIRQRDDGENHMRRWAAYIPGMEE
ncbi:MAG: hypothetical protein EKK55_22590 [Rhodocyclaceae bacterium]|nr:MAG: hypothetical protein EKK55_22590 [Rhodocyclaceae bacterium]